MCNMYTAQKIPTNAKSSYTGLMSQSMTTHDDWVTALLCIQWQWVIDFEHENPNRRKVYIDDLGGVFIERNDAGKHHFYGRASQSSTDRLNRVCATTYGHKFSSYTRYVFNRKVYCGAE